MSKTQHQIIYLKDYQEPNYKAKKTQLKFLLHEDSTLVESEVHYIKTENGKPELRLDGRDLNLISVAINDQNVPLESLDYSPNHICLSKLPDDFKLTIITEIYPQNNTALEGLYKSNGKFCTQCEPEGFRRITYFVDRPDNMSEYFVRIEADRKLYPHLLSNGNLIESGDLPGDRHFALWHDPFLKPSYLFALVAGDLAVATDQFVTKSGRPIDIRLYVEPQNHDKCEFAIEAIKDSMAWDERVFDLEYDLDIFMVVAVSDFNMGAMENKGLNIFNSKYILAKPETATDTDYEAIQGVIGHEYFHNWTGNRVTCRDWFQLSLKEGLTVFRDQEFSADLNSRPVKRILDVMSLRNSQFLEDSGPMAHPVRPDSYMEINNFYTPTVYNKGAEVIRMIDTILGRETFIKAVQHYLRSHDGRAATIEDFIDSMETISKRDFSSQFKRWYTQSGTPQVSVTLNHKDNQLTLTFVQSLPPTPGQGSKLPQLIPIRSAFFSSDGQPLEFVYDGKLAHEHTLLLEEFNQEIRIDGLKERPIPSFLRDFSAPVFLNYSYSKAELRLLIEKETNDFNRYEACQKLAICLMQEALEQKRHDKSQHWQFEEEDIHAFVKLLHMGNIDGSLIAKCFMLPTVEYLTNALSKETVDDLFDVRQALSFALANACESFFASILTKAEAGIHKPYQFTGSEVSRRELLKIALHYLSYLQTHEYLDRIEAFYYQCNNMTDTMSCLGALRSLECPQRERALAHFYETWQHDELVIDKWFAIQASSNHPDVLNQVKSLLEHPDFNLLKPNRVYAVLRQFMRCNPHGFHNRSGEGYRLLTDKIIEIDSKNSSVSSMLATSLSQWRSFDRARQALMKKELIRLQKLDTLSRDTYEIVEKSLK